MAYVAGPEKHGRKWRVAIDHGRKKCPCCGRRRHWFSYESESEASEKANAFRAELSGPKSLERALDQYLEWVRDVRRIKSESVDLYDHRIRSVLGPDIHRPLVWLGDAQAQELYDRLVASGVSTTTQLNRLARCRGWFRFLVRKRIARSNPWDSVDPVGQRASRANAQALSMDDARKLYDYCRHWHHTGATAAALVLTLGLRASELCNFELDDGGRVLVIRSGKTKAAARRLQIPDWLVRRVPKFNARNRHHVSREIRKAVEAAGIRPVVGPHALRATCASLAAAAGAPWQAFGPALGHEGPAVTRRHYERPGASESGRAAMIDQRLGAQRPERAPNPPRKNQKRKKNNG